MDFIRFTSEKSTLKCLSQGWELKDSLEKIYTLIKSSYSKDGYEKLELDISSYYTVDSLEMGRIVKIYKLMNQLSQQFELICSPNVSSIFNLCSLNKLFTITIKEN